MAYVTLTIIDDLGESTTVDFTKLSTYSNFITGRTYTITANVNIETKIYAVGGGGGTDGSRQISGTTGGVAFGGSGGASQGTFIFERGKTYKLIVGGGAGGGGANGRVGGYGGGGIGGRGKGGGGYTGLFLNSVSQTNAILIAGGGGGASNDPAAGGKGGGLTGGDASNAGDTGGTGGTQSSGGIGDPAGSALQGGGTTLDFNFIFGPLGGGGGGGGYFGGGAGAFSYDIFNDGAGGGGSGYIHPTSITNGSFDATNSAGGGGPDTDGSFKIDFVAVSIRPHININGSWYKPKDVYIKDAGSWKLCRSGYIRDGGEWKLFLGTSISPPPVTTGTVFTQLAANDSIFSYVTGLAIFSTTTGTPTPKEVERYYKIKISKNVNSIKITNIGKNTGTGEQEDPGIKLRAGQAGISKISAGPGDTSTWKITFVRSTPQEDFGYTTFVDTFTIGI